MLSIDSTRRRDVRHPPLIVNPSEKSMTCAHVDHIRNVEPSGSGCVECVRLGDEWVQLQMCMECGHVGCCDSSKNKHAVKHFRTTQHPIARSIEPGQEWAWCYVDQLWFERLPHS